MSEKNVRTGLTKEQVLAEIEDVIRQMPGRARLSDSSPEGLAWLGRAAAAIELWSPGKSIEWTMAASQLTSSFNYGEAESKLIMLLHQAQNDLRMKTTGPVNVAIGHGYVFDYMDNMMKIIGQAHTDIMFVDRYMNGDFISQFLPHAADGVGVRLLTRNAPQTAKSLAALTSMAQAFSTQYGTSIEIRSNPDHHQRYVFLDGASAYESGSSFKDGPRTAGATIIEQVGDTLSGLLTTHETLWKAGTVELQT